MTKYLEIMLFLTALTLLSGGVVVADAESTESTENNIANNKQAELLIRYPAYPIKELSHAQLQRYKQELLRLALVRSGRPFQLERVEIDVITSDRNMRNLAQGVYDVNWMHTNSEREQTLIPIRIPVYKGLIGWRLLLIRQDMRDQFAKIESLGALKSFRHGQAYDWPDTEILKYHNFNIVEASNARILMNMLKGGRIDSFPRSMVEIWSEFELHGDATSMMIDDTVVIVYPTAFYTFVDKRNQGLATIIEQGMELAIADGSFDKLFNRYFSEVIRRAELDKRKIFHLTNPGLSAQTPLHRQELWFNLGFNLESAGQNSAEPETALQE